MKYNLRNIMLRAWKIHRANKELSFGECRQDILKNMFPLVREYLENRPLIDRSRYWSEGLHSETAKGRISAAPAILICILLSRRMNS